MDHCTTLSGYIFAVKPYIDNRKKNLLNSNISSTRPHNMANFGSVAAEIGSVVRGTPANFHGFCVLALLLQRRRSPEANQTSHDVSWAGTLYIHFRSLLPLTEFCPVQNSLYVQVLCFFLLAALLHSNPAAGMSQTVRRGTRNGITELSHIWLGGHHIGHWLTF